MKCSEAREGTTSLAILLGLRHHTAMVEIRGCSCHQNSFSNRSELRNHGRAVPLETGVCKMGVKLVSLCLCRSRKTRVMLTHSHACCEPPAVTKQHQEKGGVRDALYCQQNSLNRGDYS